MGKNRSSGIVGRLLALLASALFVGVPLWLGLTQKSGVPYAPAEGVWKRAPAPLRAGRLAITDGPRLTTGTDGHRYIEWTTSVAADSFVTYEKGDSLLPVVKDSAYATSHRFPLPDEPFIQFRRFQVVSVAENREDIGAGIGPGGGGRWAVFPDSSRDYGLTDKVRPAAAIAWGDCDSDGRLDAAVCRRGDGEGELILRRAGQGRTARVDSLPPTSDVGALQWLDCNDDGLLDLLSVGRNLTVYINIGAPDGELRKANVFDGPVREPMVAAALTDVNGDGLTDVAAVTDSGHVIFWRNGGPADFHFRLAAVADLPAGTPSASMLFAVADFNGDDRLDVFGGRGAPTLLASGGDGYKPVAGAFPGDVSAAWAAPGDWDGDGDLDLCLGAATGVQLLRNGGDGRFSDMTIRAGELARLADPASCAAWADLDGNGELDLVLGMEAGGLKLFLNAGDGQFMNATDLCAVRVPSGAKPTDVVAADLNGDADPDLCVRFEDGALVVLENHWWDRPLALYLRVEPAGRPMPWGTVITLCNEVTDEVMAARWFGSARIGAVTGPAGCSFGVAETRSARVEARFPDGSTMSYPWVRGTETSGVLKVEATRREDR